MSRTPQGTQVHWWPLVAVFVLPCPIHAQPPPDTAASTEQQYLDLIEREQEAGGLTAPTLLEPLTALAQQYFAREEYDQAFEAYARARQVLRVNAGFDTLAELPLLQQLVHTEEARGRLAEAWALEQSLLSLAGQHLGAMETLPVFLAAADHRLALRRAYLGGSRPPQIVLGCYYGKDEQVDALVRRGVPFSPTVSVRGNCSAGERDTVNVALLLEARAYQFNALEALLRNGRYASAELWDVLMEILRTSDSIQRRLPLFNDRQLGQLMTRLLSHEPADYAAAVRRAHILIQLADINVVRTRQADRYVGYDAVIEQYQQAYAMLRNENFTQVELDALFAPALPMVLPAFFTNPLEGAAEQEAKGYIDVSFEITRQGKSRRVEVRGMSEGLEGSDRRRLTQLLDQSSFRPRLAEGLVLEVAPVSLRYYVPVED